MEDLINLQKKIYPDLLGAMHQRYSVLYSVDLFQPIGRRGLVENTNLTERNVRNEVNHLHNQGLIKITTKGMHVTKEGKLVIDQLHGFIREISGLNSLEKKLKNKLQVNHVIVVSGDSDQNDWVKQEMGKACVSFLKTNIKSESTIAVTGGTTMAAIADVMTPLGKENKHLFVPARGGIGEEVENQANTIVAKMAQKEKGDYRLLYVPDPLSETSYETLINEPSINETLQLIKSSGVILHGIGDAQSMAKRRKTPEAIIKKLTENNAVSEAFGYYFDRTGKVVHKVRTIGIQLEDLAATSCVITVAGGKSKALAIASYMKQKKSSVLITDESAAEQILNISGEQKVELGGI